MKSLFVQIQGLVFNLFLVFIFIAYSKVNNVAVNTLKEPKKENYNNIYRGEGLKVQTLKRIVLLQLITYKIFNVQLLLDSSNLVNLNISVKDGQIKLTSSNLKVQTFQYIIAGIVIYYQSNYNLIKEYASHKEKYIIYLTNQLGITFLIISNDWILTIVSWELFNKSLYLLVSLQSKNEAGLAASLKYFLLSALSTAFLLLGVCILYFKTGSTNYEIIDTCVIELLRNGGDAYIELAFSLILFTLLFKLSAAPFYQWAPDLYENIQTNITMWMILIPKLAVLTFLVFFSSAFSLFLQLASVQWILFITSTLSIIIGSIALSNQWYIKRFFAFSGISHVGFMLLALYSLDTQAFFFYMFIYAVTTVNIFSILIILSQFFGRDLKLIQDLSGIFKFNPFLSFAFALNLFSLSGVCLIFILLLARIFYQLDLSPET